MDKETADLLAERHRLVAYDLTAAVAAVDAELARKGFNPDGSPVEQAKDEKPSKDDSEPPKDVAPVNRQAPKRAKA